ncbi:predicted protein [Plenodomus lingam JN3]|uniref:Predicted protein n=1 Tax=Leptosphaeria maculans (strain JN3 / isolate v23.1.3 / race Av1-4-5-6-7-8) TaxID=985895 RepID=E4ZUT8_LEPMJ|nr:predicted protein [Plenodomus lingam JN3]CBX95167.1 predicted protein [Plenodomus lingam JN3]
MPSAVWLFSPYHRTSPTSATSVPEELRARPPTTVTVIGSEPNEQAGNERVTQKRSRTREAVTLAMPRQTRSVWGNGVWSIGEGASSHRSPETGHSVGAESVGAWLGQAALEKKVFWNRSQKRNETQEWKMRA